MISIIVPVFNSEKYINTCVDSLLSQTYQDLEIILVDDGSYDKSPLLCDDYAVRDKRVIVIHKRNGGVSAARNCGLDLAKGEYIMFVDSDDALDVNCCQELLNAVNHADYAPVFIRNYTSNKNKEWSLPDVCCQSTLEYLKDTLLHDVSLGVVEGIYRREIIERNNLRFNTSARTGEDQEFVYKYLICAQTIGKTSNSFYYYRTDNEFSVMHQSTYKHFDAVEAIQEVIRFAENRLPKKDYAFIKNAIFNQKIPHIIFFACVTLLNAKESPEKLLAFMRTKGYHKLLDSADAPPDAGYATFVRLWKYSPALCLYLYSIRKAGGRMLRKAGLRK